MDWQFTPQAVPLLAASVLSAVLSLYSWRHRRVPAAPALALLLLGACVWSASYGAELSNPTLPGQIFWAKAKYLGVGMVPLAWLSFALQYTGRGRLLTSRVLALLTLEPILTLLLVSTNEAHGLIWSRVTPVPAGPPIMQYGPGFWVHVAYSYTVLFVSTVLLLRTLLTSLHVYRRYVGAVLIAVLAPWLSNALYVLRVGPAARLDLTPLAFTVTGVAFAWALFRLRFLDVVPVAREAVFDGLEDAVFVLDVNGRVVDINPAGEQILLRRAWEVVGQAAEQVFAARADLVDAFCDVHETSVEVLLQRDGKPRDYELRISPLRQQSGAPAGRLVILRDITEHKRLLAEQAASRTEARFRALVQHSTDLIAIVDAEARIRYHSPAIERVAGASAEQIKGTDLVSLAHPGDAKRVRKTLAALAARPGTSVLMEWRIRHRDGSERWLETVATNLLEQSEVQGLVLNSRDVSERKALESERTEKARLEGVLLAARTMEHELNNRLSLTVGYAELLAADVTLAEKHRELARQALEGARTASELLTQLNRLEALEEKTWPAGLSPTISLDPPAKLPKIA